MLKVRNINLLRIKLEKNLLENQKFRTEFNFERIKISKKTSDRHTTGTIEIFTLGKGKNYVKSSMFKKKY